MAPKKAPTSGENAYTTPKRRRRQTLPSTKKKYDTRIPESRVPRNNRSFSIAEPSKEKPASNENEVEQQKLGHKKNRAGPSTSSTEIPTKQHSPKESKNCNDNSFQIIFDQEDHLIDFEPNVSREEETSLESDKENREPNPNGSSFPLIDNANERLDDDHPDNSDNGSSITVAQNFRIPLSSLISDGSHQIQDQVASTSHPRNHAPSRLSQAW